MHESYTEPAKLQGEQLSKNPGGAWNSNDSLSATVIRNAGFGAMTGALGGGLFALAGGVIGALYGFSSHSGNG